MTCIILLATKNGANFLSEQLESIEKQEYKNWVVFASDDGSTDSTLDVLLRYKKRWGGGKLIIQKGPKNGFQQNFWFLLHQVKKNQFSYFAFCDQDDIWSEFHLKRSIDTMKSFPKIPFLYCSRTQYIDEYGGLLDFSPEFLRKPCFQNALVQNIAGGNTMVFNSAAFNFLKKIPVDYPIVSHDWMTYIIVTAIGGRVLYNQDPSVYYRQHSANIVGRNDRLQNQIMRIFLLLRGRFREWNSQNLNCLKLIDNKISKPNKEVLRRFVKYRDQNFFMRLIKIYRLYLFRQTRKGQIALYLGYLLKKI